MSLSTVRALAYATLFTYDNSEIHLTEPEYQIFLKVTKNPSFKFLEFDDGGVAISDVRRFEIIRRVDGEMPHQLLMNKNDPRLLDSGDILVEEEISEEQQKIDKEIRDRDIERKKDIAKGIDPYKKRIEPLSIEEEKDRRSLLLEQAKKL